VDYLKFTRVMRGQCVRSVTSTFEETIDSRLNEGTFTADEVKEMMTGKPTSVTEICEISHHYKFSMLRVQPWVYFNITGLLVCSVYHCTAI